MTLTQFIRLLLKNYWILISIPLVVGIGIFFLSRSLPMQYESSTVIFTNPTTDRGANDGGAIRMDFYTSNNLFDNLTLLLRSRETVTQASLRLLSMHLMQEKPDPEIISQENFEDLPKHISDALRRQLVVPGDLDATYANTARYHAENPNSPIEYLLREHPVYGVTNIIRDLFVARKASSDMMEVTFRATDAANCYYILRFITEGFMERYANIKEAENVNSIIYFEDQLRIAESKLRAAEAILKEFVTENRILNYYEQGKYLDIAKLEHEQDEERSKRLISGTMANLEKIEALFEGFDRRQHIIREIGELQSQMVTKKLALEGGGLSRNGQTYRAQLSEEIRHLEQEIETKSTQLFNNSISLEGLQRREALDEWLKLKLSYEEQAQALDVMQERKEYLQSKIDEFAPLGAELKRLEREVSVNESQYLSILHGLNMAYLKKYDLEMTSSQKLIDEPFFPKKALPSKKAFFVLGGVVGSGFFTLSILLLFFFLDNSVRSAARAEALTGLQVAGGWVDERKLPNGVYLDQLRQQLLAKFSNNINRFLDHTKRPNIVTFYSLSEGTGKSHLIEHFAKKLATEGRSFTYYALPNSVESSGTYPITTYATSELLETHNAMWNERFNRCETDYLLLELPNLAEHHINYSLINQTSVCVLVLDATKPWPKATQTLLNNITATLTIPHVLWLNQLGPEELEDFNGEIPKKRSKLRKWAKDLIS